MKNAFLTKTLVGVCALGFALANPASAADPATHPLSRDHVNLVRVQGQKITDVVYDTQALEVSADDRQTRIALAAPLMKLETGDFVSDLKLLVQKSVTADIADDVRAVGSLSGAEDDRRFASLPAPEGSVYWEGFKVRETRAFLTADKLTETLLFTRVSPKASVPDAARLACVIRGVLAVAQEVRTGDRLQTEVTIIRSREAALRGREVFESVLTELSGAVPSHSRTEERR